MERFLTPEAARERDLAFLEAFALGRQPPLRPTVQDLERHAAAWAELVPDSPRSRAALAHQMGLKYRLRRGSTPGIRAALGLDQESVQATYRQSYGQPLESLYAARATPADGLRWLGAAVGARLDALSPFWTAFALTLTETVGAGILALPIAVAGVGPIAGVAILIVLGVVSVITIGSMAESVARSGTMRYGTAFLGRAVADYLGGLGAAVLSAGVAAICVLALLAYYVGFSSVLAAATHLRPEVWTAVLFLIGLFFVSRKSLNSTVASAVVIGAINIGLIVVLSLLSLPHLRADNFAYVNFPFLAGRPLEPGLLQVIFGVILAAYFGHLSISNCAHVVLRRDPSASSLVRGGMAAQVVTMLLYSGWVLVVNGLVPPQTLARQSGTALGPLSEQVGPLVLVLGSIFAVLGMGMGSVHFTLGLYNLVGERLPTRRSHTLLMQRQRSRLVLQPRGKNLPRASVEYCGLEGNRPTFKLHLHTATAPGAPTRQPAALTLRLDPGGSWHSEGLAGALPGLDTRGIRLAFDVLEARAESARISVTSPMRISCEGGWYAAGLRPVDLLRLPDAQRRLLTWMMRRGQVKLQEVARQLGSDESSAWSLLQTLCADGLVEQDSTGDGEIYRARLAATRPRELIQDIRRVLDTEQMTEDRPQRTEAARQATEPSGRLREALSWAVAEGPARFVIANAPTAMIFLLAEWLFLSGTESFAAPLGFIGVIVVSLLGGVFPVLLLEASRRRGEFVPGVIYPILGHPVVVACIYLLSLASLFVHGLIIWQNPLQRASALFVGVLVVAMTAILARRGAFSARAVIQLRQAPAPANQAVLDVVSGGRPAQALVRLVYPDGEERRQDVSVTIPRFHTLQYAAVDVPAGESAELKVWAHRVTPDGDSEPLPALLEAHSANHIHRIDLQRAGGRALLPMAKGVSHLRIIRELETGD
jgi:hypothetical protein